MKKIRALLLVGAMMMAGRAGAADQTYNTWVLTIIISGTTGNAGAAIHSTEYDSKTACYYVREKFAERWKQSRLGTFAMAWCAPKFILDTPEAQGTEN